MDRNMIDHNKLNTASLVLLIEKLEGKALTLTDDEIGRIAQGKYIECYRDYENKTYTLSIKMFSEDDGK